MAYELRAGPLMGDEEARAIALLSDRQLRAYRYRRQGHAWDWIARQMGISRPAVIHLVARAERRLGYKQTVSNRQPTPYKPVAARREEADSTWLAQIESAAQELASTPWGRTTLEQWAKWEAELPPAEFKRRLRRELTDRVAARRRVSAREEPPDTGPMTHARSAQGRSRNHLDDSSPDEVWLTSVSGEPLRGSEFVPDRPD